ncbi:putative D-lactaldehyde dehydrogenase [Meredithblackwellia eburnea MCA 4105]
MSSSKLLITGVSGYIGSACALQALSQGFRVRGAVRRKEQGDDWYKSYPTIGKDLLEFVVVPDMTVEAAWAEAIKGVEGVVHVASPVDSSQVKDVKKDQLDPAINGTLRILESAANEPSVKVVVLTSSAVAFMDPANLKSADESYTASDFTPTTYEQASEPGFNHFSAYAASKALAEQVAWKFVEQKKPGFTLTTICPAWCLGPSCQPKIRSPTDLPPTLMDFWLMVVDNKMEQTLPPPPFLHFVDVRDVAASHIAVFSNPAAANGKRFPLVGGRWSYTVAGQLLASHFPDQKARIRTDGEEELGDAYDFEDSFAAEDILGIEYTRLTETIRDTGSQLFSLPN